MTFLRKKSVICGCGPGEMGASRIEIATVASLLRNDTAAAAGAVKAVAKRKAIWHHL